MAKVIFGNHSAVIVPRKDRDRIQKFYCDVLGCKITRENDQKDDLRMGENFYRYITSWVLENRLQKLESFTCQPTLQPFL